MWFQDAARVGQKNGYTRIWAKKGSRPRLPAGQRYKSAYRFDFSGFVIEEGETVFHKADDTDVFLDLFNTDILSGEYG